MMSKPQSPTGLIAPALTPFRPDGSIDYGRFRDQAAELLMKGMHGISPGGSTGEGAVLEDHELSRLVTEARAAAGDRPVVAGGLPRPTPSAGRPPPPAPRRETGRSWRGSSAARRRARSAPPSPRGMPAPPRSW